MLSGLILLSSLVAPPSPQPTPEPSPAPPVFYETATVTARPVSSASGAVSVTDAKDAEAAEARSGTDLLRGVPGLNAFASGGRAGVTHAFLRGADPNYTLVLLDGIPLNDATELQGGAVNLEEIPSLLVERAEVVRGPLTSFYGTQALAGVLQLFTPRGGPGPLRIDLGLEAGNAALRQGFVRLAGPAGETGGFAGGGSWAEEERRIGDDRFRQLDLWSSGDLRFGEAASLALTGRFADGSADDYPDASGGPIHGSGELRRTDRRSLALGARLELGAPGAVRHRVFVGVSRRDQDRDSPAVPPVVPASVETTAYTRLRVAWETPIAGGARTRFDVGLSGEAEWGDNDSLLRMPAFMGGDRPGDYTKRRASAGGFAGLRHERGRLLYEAALRADQSSGGAVQLNPHAGAVLRLGPGDETRLRVSGGRASKLPSFFALASPPALGGNPDLEAEHVWGGEAGLEHRFAAARLELAATGFLQRYTNLVDFDFDRFLHVNRARVRMRGIELTVRWRPTASLAIDGDATYLEVSDLGGGALLHAPRWTGGGRLTWRPVSRLSLRLQTRASSRYLDQQYPVPDHESVDGYGLLGAAASWRAGSGLVLRARADNLTDRDYETLIGFPGPGRSWWAGIGWERR